MRLSCNIASICRPSSIDGATTPTVRHRPSPRSRSLRSCQSSSCPKRTTLSSSSQSFSSLSTGLTGPGLWRPRKFHRRCCSCRTCRSRTPRTSPSSEASRSTSGSTRDLASSVPTEQESPRCSSSACSERPLTLARLKLLIGELQPTTGQQSRNGRLRIACSSSPLIVSYSHERRLCPAPH